MCTEQIGYMSSPPDELPTYHGRLRSANTARLQKECQRQRCPARQKQQCLPLLFSLCPGGGSSCRPLVSVPKQQPAQNRGRHGKGTSRGRCSKGARRGRWTYHVGMYVYTDPCLERRLECVAPRCGA